LGGGRNAALSVQVGRRKLRLERADRSAHRQLPESSTGDLSLPRSSRERKRHVEPITGTGEFPCSSAGLAALVVYADDAGAYFRTCYCGSPVPSSTNKSHPRG